MARHLFVWSRFAAGLKSLATRRSGSPIGNHFQHRTMVHDGGMYHTKNNNNKRRVYLLQCRYQLPYHCVYKRMHL